MSLDEPSERSNTCETPSSPECLSSLKITSYTLNCTPSDRPVNVTRTAPDRSSRISRRAQVHNRDSCESCNCHRTSQALRVGGSIRVRLVLHAAWHEV